MNYSAAELFTPAPSGVGPFGNVPNVPAQGTWLGQMLANAATVGLPTTSWQSGAHQGRHYGGAALGALGLRTRRRADLDGVQRLAARAAPRSRLAIW